MNAIDETLPAPVGDARVAAGDSGGEPTPQGRGRAAGRFLGH